MLYNGTGEAGLLPALNIYDLIIGKTRRLYKHINIIIFVIK